ncbi:MAG: molybdopterin molybdotransferase MoeA [Halobacteriales archaeon]
MTHGPDAGEVEKLADARRRLLDAVEAHGRTETRTLVEAAGAVLARPVAAERAVPHYERATRDGFAVRSGDTRTDGRDGVELALVGGDAPAEQVDRGQAAWVNTGSPLPAGADAVVMVENARRRDGTVEVPVDVAAGEYVEPAGSDIAAGQQLFDAGHRLAPGDLGLLRSTGHESVPAFEPPRVSVIPTGEELVAAGADPAPGKVVETNGLVGSRLVEQWGGDATYRDVVTDDAASLAGAIERDLDHDLVATSGGTALGDRDLLSGVLGERGSMAVHGLAISPGHSAGFGVVEDTPVVMLPGSPGASLVVATQLLRPAVAAAGGFDPDPFPTTTATLSAPIRSDEGRRTFARVAVAHGRAEPVGGGGAGAPATAAQADGWIVVPEAVENRDAGDEVAVQRWDWWP